MATLCNSCTECDWEEFSNDRVSVCPNCEGAVHTTSDEEEEYYDGNQDYDDSDLEDPDDAEWDSWDDYDELDID